MGTWPVFLTAVSTILGAILFLRFGYSIAHIGLVQTLLIILLGHLVTVPAALAVAEISTNQKVEGGGAYFMISRSFGLNIGGAIGIALFLSQAISVAFYIIAFTVSIRNVLAWAEVQYGVVIDPLFVNLGMMGLLTLLMLTKGANVGSFIFHFLIKLEFGLAGSSGKTSSPKKEILFDFIGSIRRSKFLKSLPRAVFIKIEFFFNFFIKFSSTIF